MKKNRLHQLYEQKQQRILIETMILEAFDKDKMAKSLELIKRLRAIDWKNLKTFKTYVDDAVGFIKKDMAGEKQQGVFGWIKSLFTSEEQNPLLDVLSFAKDLNDFFEVMDQYVKTEKPNLANETEAKTFKKFISNGLSKTKFIKSKLSKNLNKIAEEIFQASNANLNDPNKESNLTTVAKQVASNLENIDQVYAAASALENKLKGSKQPTETTTADEPKGGTAPEGASPAAPTQNPVKKEQDTTTLGGVANTARKLRNPDFIKILKKAGITSEDDLKKIISGQE